MSTHEADTMRDPWIRMASTMEWPVSLHWAVGSEKKFSRRLEGEGGVLESWKRVVYLGPWGQYWTQGSDSGSVPVFLRLHSAPICCQKPRE